MSPPTRAKLMALDPPKGEVTFQYNPTKYSVSKSVEWTFQARKGGDVPPVEFVQGQGRTVSLELFLDGLEDNKDVSESVKQLQNFMLVDEKNKKDAGKPRPPRVMLFWAKSTDFPAVIKTLNVTYNMFHPDGRPARATVSMTLQEVHDIAKSGKQNPSSFGSEGIRSHRVVAGETLDIIAYNELGSASHWRYIAELNNLDNPFDLRPGQQLAIAQLP